MLPLAAGTIFLVGVAIFCALVARAGVAPFGVALLYAAAVTLAAAAAYYATDAVGRPPLRWAAETVANGALFVVALLALMRGLESLRTIAVVGLVLHGGWDLLHVLAVLSPPRHEWLPAACVLVDWVLALSVALVSPERSTAPA